MKKPSTDDVAELMKKFADAGWIRRSSLIGPIGDVTFTPKGQQRMESLLDAFGELQGVSDGQLSALIGLMGEYHKGKHDLS